MLFLTALGVDFAEVLSFLGVLRGLGGEKVSQPSVVVTLTTPSQRSY